MAKEEKKGIQELLKASGLEKNEDKTFTYCQKFAEIRTANGTCTIKTYFEKESEVKRIDVRPEDHQAPDGSQRSFDMRNAFRFYYMGSIAVAQNKVVTNKDIKSVEVGIESQTLPYNLKPIEAAKTSYVSVMIEPDFKQRAKSKKESPMDLRKTVKIDDVNKIKVE
ncbi:hypothetical protein F8M41_013615 [Gigaspora margarita]|uniref:Uncharacterized protein n=1 Tax=Gigaspora margarita TaxID=4874 RepID=A0A8H4EP89_GIGMA|nr:hypothetical protein F8M41_013615 [Gigaspora margarita]